MRALSGLTVIALLSPLSLSAQAAPVSAPAGPWKVFERPRTRAAQPTTAEITPDDLMSRLYPFADDSMGGRNLGEIGNVKGTDFIAREAQRLGLKPAGERGTFFQTIPVFTRTLDESRKVSIGMTTLTPWTDFVPRDMGGGQRSVENVPVVYGGNWTVAASLISPDSVEGKLVVLSVPQGPTAIGPPGTANRFGLTRYYRKAAGIAVAGLDQIGSQYVAENFRGGNQEYRDGEGASVPSFMYVTRRVAGLLLGRSVDSVATGTRGEGGFSAAPAFGERPIEHPGRNVVGIIEGSDPALKGQYVLLGAHNDHVNYHPPAGAHDSLYVLNHLWREGGLDDPDPPMPAARVDSLNALLALIRQETGGRSARPDSIYNGADDDGSGSMGLLEIAEWFSKGRVKPKRSLLFVWHVAEEAGLFGSEYFSNHPTVPRDSIVAGLNMDMIGRGSSSDVTGNTKEGGRIRGNQNYLQLVGSRRVSTELGDLAERVNVSGKFGLVFDYSMDANGHPQNIYCRSDHYNYARFAIPIIFFTTGGHADYHMVTDEPQYIDYSRLTRVTRFVATLAETVAGLDRRPLVDKPKPDPRGECVQ
ncbi:MAG: M28 family peptidase [Gemmatimonadales bacterium]|nr:M28 family peptidase [Gemmatimonadales bacterium]